MLYIGEKVGLATPRTAVRGRCATTRSTSPSIRSKARTCARPARRTRSRCSRRRTSGGLLHAPDLYMEKLVVGPSSKDAVSLDAPVHENLKAIAALPRPPGRGSGRRSCSIATRHEKLIDDIRATGARIRLIGDGDLSAGIAAAVVGSGVHAVMGTGGAPEGVLTAAAMRCLNGEIFARLVVSKPEHEERCRAMGITDFKKVYRSKDLAPGKRHHLCRDRRDRRHADARRPVLRRRHPHQLGDHAERPAPHPVHRQHPRRSRRPTSRSSSDGLGLDISTLAIRMIRSPQRRRHELAAQCLRRHRRVVHGLHRLHAGDAVPAAVHRPARRHRRRRRSRCGPASASASRRR